MTGEKILDLPQRPHRSRRREIRKHMPILRERKDKMKNLFTAIAAISRIVENILQPFDNENRELILRWRLWKTNWLPYRTAEILNLQDDTAEDLILGPWKWNLPRKLRDMSQRKKK